MTPVSAPTGARVNQTFVHFGVGVVLRQAEQLEVITQ